MNKPYSAGLCDLLMTIDRMVYADSLWQVETAHGCAAIRKAKTPGYTAELHDGDELPEAAGYGPTPAIAFLQLTEALEKHEIAQHTDNVIVFPSVINRESDRSPQRPSIALVSNPRHSQKQGDHNAKM